MGLGLLQAGWPGKAHLEMVRISELRKDLEQNILTEGTACAKALSRE